MANINRIGEGQSLPLPLSVAEKREILAVAKAIIKDISENRDISKFDSRLDKIRKFVKGAEFHKKIDQLIHQMHLGKEKEKVVEDRFFSLFEEGKKTAIHKKKPSQIEAATTGILTDLIKGKKVNQKDPRLNAIHHKFTDDELEEIIKNIKKKVQTHETDQNIKNAFRVLLGEPPGVVIKRHISPMSLEAEEIPTFSNEKEALSEIQNASLKGDIVKAASLMDEYRKLSGKTTLNEIDICQCFEIQDDSISEGKWKGITTIGHYNTEILLEERETGVDRNPNNLKIALTTNPRGLLFFRKEDQTFQPMRYSDEEVQIYDKKSGQWKKCEAEDLEKLNLKEDDLMISLGSFVNVTQGAGVYKRIETPGPTRSQQGYFYHEAQGPNSGSFCAVHAANAFLGYHAIDISSFYQFARESLIGRFQLPLESVYEFEANVADVRAGADPATLMEYLNFLSESGKLPKKFETFRITEVKSSNAWDETRLERIPTDIDRVIIGYGGSHFSAARKDAENGKWYVIDSLDPNSQNIAYDSLEEAIKTPARSEASSVYVIY